MFASAAHAQVLHEQSPVGDFFAYIPEQTPENILVIAHGKLADNDDASKLARKFLDRWIPYAERYGLLVIAPVFDTPRFGNRGGGYGGYRNLFGRYLPADRFVNDLVDRFAERTRSRSNRFYLYGHSAGGQFANRYAVTHPERIIRAVVSAAGRYSYPTRSVAWPYGAGDLTRNIKWRDGGRTPVSVSRSLERYAEAATRIDIVIGDRDTRPQPRRPAHQGSTRIDFAHSWAGEMNRNAKNHGVLGTVRVHLIAGVGHDSARLTPHCARLLFGGH